MDSLPYLVCAPSYIQHMGWYCALSGIGAIYAQFLRLQGAANHPPAKASETCQQSAAGFCAHQDHLETGEALWMEQATKPCQVLTPGVAVLNKRGGVAWREALILPRKSELM